MSLWLALVLAVLVYLLACAVISKFQSRLVFYPLPKLADSPAAYNVSFHDVTIPGPAFSIHGWWMPAAPEAPVMLYLHGNGGNIGAYAAQAARLRGLGYSVLIIDYRGYGQSSGPFPCERRVYEDAELAWQWLTGEMKILPSQICIYGHSLGGAVAIELATQHPEATALIVESSFTSALAMGKHLQVFRIFPLRALLTYNFNSVAKVPNLKLPVLFMHGTRDLTVPCRMSRDLHAVAAEPKELVIFPGAMHMNCGESAPDLYRESVTRFINRVLAAARPVTEVTIFPDQPTF